jgi:hypothetical protein
MPVAGTELRLGHTVMILIVKAASRTSPDNVDRQLVMLYGMPTSFWRRSWPVSAGC